MTTEPSTLLPLTAAAVNAVLDDCFFREDELDAEGAPITAIPVKVCAIVTNFGFHPERLEAHRAEVTALLDQLPVELDEGCSFLNLCMTRTGEQWGEHRDMEALMALAEGLGLVALCLSREFWRILPGGMPYYQRRPLPLKQLHEAAP